MGDRTWVELSISQHDKKAFERIMTDAGETADSFTENDQYINYFFDEVNYADLIFEKALHKARIPYDKVWGQGDEYSAGKEYCRVGEDEQINLSTFSEQSTQGMVALDLVVEAFENGLLEEKLKQWKTQNEIPCLYSINHIEQESQL